MIQGWKAGTDKSAGVENALTLMLRMPKSDTLEKMAVQDFGECEEILRAMYAEVSAPTPKAVFSKDEVQRFAKHVARPRRAAETGLPSQINRSVSVPTDVPTEETS
jgi:hypothetical protein